MTSIVFYQAELKTPLGVMIAVADERFLYLLEFNDSKNLRLKLRRFNAPINPGRTHIHDHIENEILNFFSRNLQQFKTPVFFQGTYFQKAVWTHLAHIPFGQAISYKMLAGQMEKPTAYRAVANANANNSLAIIIPCHRVISHTKEIGGYAGGIDRKEFLLKLEGINLH